MCPLLQPWLMAEIMNSYQEEYDQDISEVHNPVQKVTTAPQGCRDEIHVIEIGLDDNGRGIGLFIQS